MKILLKFEIYSHFVFVGGARHVDFKFLSCHRIDSSQIPEICENQAEICPVSKKFVPDDVV